MDLRRNQITVGELLDNPRSRAVIQRRFPTAASTRSWERPRTVTLEQMLAFAVAYLPQKKIDEAMEELRRV